MRFHMSNPTKWRCGAEASGWAAAQARRRRTVVTRLALLAASVLISSSGWPGEVKGQVRAYAAPLTPTKKTVIASCHRGDAYQGPVWSTILESLEAEDRKEWRPALRALADSLGAEARAAPSNVPAQYLYAAALGAVTDVEGGRTQVSRANELHAQVERVLALEPGHAGAMHLLGRLNVAALRVGGLKRFIAAQLLGADIMSSASWEGAERLLRSAEEAGPCVPDHHYELGRLYAERGDPERAREEMEHVMYLAGDTRRRDVVDKARALYERLVSADGAQSDGDE